MTDAKRKLAAILSADVVGYSRLMAADERATMDTLNTYRNVFRSRVSDYHGRVVDTAGDSVLAVFDSAVEAVQCAVDVQGELGERNTELAEDRQMSFRIGVNLGDVFEQDDGTIYGDGVNVAARIEALAEPGGVCVSGKVFDEVENRTGLKFRFWGEQSLKNISRPVRTYHVEAEGLSTPQAATPAFRAPTFGNLPYQATSFIGRESELVDVDGVLGRAHCVTLTGVGGAGKTRLSLEAAARNADRYKDGAWLCELAPVTVPEAVGHALASALRIEQHAAMSIEESIVEVLKTKRLLLLFDNCEHVLDRAATLVDAIVRACPNVTVLATSREALAIDGENVISVPPLTTPEVGDAMTAEDAARSDSVTLFVDRARSVRPDFSLTEENYRAVAEICRRLDGVPLAIELAAARVRSMAPADIARRLDERFRLLTAGRRTAVPRHQTLRAAVDWSYDLLTEEEQRLFNRLWVFVGGFTLEAAEEVCSGDGVEAADVLDLIDSVVDKSLVLAEDAVGSIRYRLLETFRQYGEQRIADGGTAAQLQRSHAAYYVAFAEQGEPEIRGPNEIEWVRRFDAEFGNFRAAHAWIVSAGETDLALRLAACMTLYAIFRMRLEPTAWAEVAIDMPGAERHALTPYVAGYASWGVWMAGSFDKAKDYGERALAAEKSIGTKPTWLPRHALMCVAFNEADAAEALKQVDDQLAISRAQGDTVRVAHELMAKSVYCHELAEESQLALAEECERLAIAGGNPAVLALAHFTMATALEDDDPERAIGYIDECLRIGRLVQHRWVIASALTLQGALRVQHREPREALVSIYEAIDVWNRAGNKASQWRTIRCAVPALAELHANDSAAIVHGATAEKSFMGAFPAGFDEHLTAANRLVEQALGSETYRAAVERGRRMSDDDAISYAMSEITRLISD